MMNIFVKMQQSLYYRKYGLHNLHVFEQFGEPSPLYITNTNLIIKIKYREKMVKKGGVKMSQL